MNLHNFPEYLFRSAFVYEKWQNLANVIGILEKIVRIERPIL